MNNYLIERGIDPKRIIIEDKSINTYQNITFSKKKIDENNKSGKIIFATTNYHVFRSGVIANNEGIECEGNNLILPNPLGDLAFHVYGLCARIYDPEAAAATEGKPGDLRGCTVSLAGEYCKKL